MSVVVPIVQGNSCNQIINRAIAFAESHDVPVVVLLSTSLDTTTQDDIDDEIDRLTDLLDEKDVAFRIVTRLDSADLATKIRETAIESEASIIIISLAPKPHHGSYQLGHQVQKLLVDAPCEVLVMRDTANNS